MSVSLSVSNPMLNLSTKFGQQGSSSSSSNNPKVQDEAVDDEETKEEEEAYIDVPVVEPDEPREHGTSAGDVDGGVGGEFFTTKMSKKKPKRGNKICGWSWRERRCQPAPLCDYKYQASLPRSWSSVYFLTC